MRSISSSESFSAYPYARTRAIAIGSDFHPLHLHGAAQIAAQACDFAVDWVLLPLARFIAALIVICGLAGLILEMIWR